MDNITEEEKAEQIIKEEDARIMEILSGISQKHGMKKIILMLVNMEQPSQELGVLKTEIRQSFVKFEDKYEDSSSI
jgi:hypothetical protein